MNQLISGAAATKRPAIKIVVVPIPADVVEKVGDPAYQPSIIPAKTYEGQDKDVPAATISTGTNLVLYVWYDNEYGYSSQVVRVLEYMASSHPQVFPTRSAVAEA